MPCARGGAEAFILAPWVVPPASCPAFRGGASCPRWRGRDALGTAAGIFWRVTSGSLTHSNVAAPVHVGAAVFPWHIMTARFTALPRDIDAVPLSSLPLPRTTGGDDRWGSAGLQPALVLATGFSRWSSGRRCSPSRAGLSRASRPSGFIQSLPPKRSRTHPGCGRISVAE